MQKWDTDQRYNHGRKAWSNNKHKELVEPLLQEIFYGWDICPTEGKTDMEEKIDYILRRDGKTIRLASRVRHFYSMPTMFNVYESNDVTIRETEIKSKADCCIYCVLDEDGESIARWHIFDVKKLLDLIKEGKIEYTERTNRGADPFKFFIVPLPELRKHGCLWMERDVRQEKSH
jgi:hypothetical protein